MSIVKINALTVPAEQREVLEQRFASRAGSVEGSDGFEWFELLRPVEGTDQYLVYTRWRSEEDFQAWMEGPMKAAHQGCHLYTSPSPRGRKKSRMPFSALVWGSELCTRDRAVGVCPRAVPGGSGHRSGRRRGV
ncbi:antibiotic biosynthesis monooxygenase [Streptomyces sp. ICC4]|uniref:antibiotic biosynthesis monooxygenase family protein n=1 Tax=Streptomyces sp. ICC4 TaxID=2099584 RepID=UPI001EF9A684|nr:antibiotic biosynthesis monooxygenase [Streptomyces sp. ICC4]